MSWGGLRPSYPCPSDGIFDFDLSASDLTMVAGEPSLASGSEPNGRLGTGDTLPYLIAIAGIAVVVVLMFQYWFVTLPLVLLVVGIVYVPRIVRHVRKNRYFSSPEFLARKAEIASVVAEHNDIAAYASEVRTKGTFELGASSTGRQSHLASFQNTSQFNYQRDRNVAAYADKNVHNCSLQVVRNAKADPLKYLMKYFDIKPTESRLAQVEEVGESVGRLENAIENLRLRERAITASIRPPKFILTHYRSEFMSHIGVTLSPILVPYPEYRFQYVSAGGNSSQQTVITLTTATIDELVETLSEKVRFSKSAAGQRALMTARLREYIKHRDGYTCKACSVSVAAEPNLLLEVDHIVPVSKGGLSVLENLQTLCWRCNRRKANKILVD